MDLFCSAAESPKNIAINDNNEIGNNNDLPKL